MGENNGPGARFLAAARRPSRSTLCLAVGALLACIGTAADTTVRVVGLNAGAGSHSRDLGSCKWCPAGHCEAATDDPAGPRKLTNDYTIVGLRRLLGREAVDAASRQVWQLLGMIGRMDPDHPILVTGDFNIREDGRHTTLGVSAAHRRAYRATARIFVAAGFERLGLRPGDDPLQPPPCDAAGTCTFKSWNDYSTLDYLFLRDPHDRIVPGDVTLVRPTVDEDCMLTDHNGLRVDLVFVD